MAVMAIMERRLRVAQLRLRRGLRGTVSNWVAFQDGSGAAKNRPPPEMKENPCATRLGKAVPPKGEYSVTDPKRRRLRITHLRRRVVSWGNIAGLFARAQAKCQADVGWTEAGSDKIGPGACSRSYNNVAGLIDRVPEPGRSTE